MLVKNDQISLTEETNKTENLWTHGVAVLLFRKRKNDRNMISWWVALKLYASQTALEGTHKSSRPESRSPPSPHFGHHRNNVEAWFCGEGGGEEGPIGLRGIVPPTILSNRRTIHPISLFCRGSVSRPWPRISLQSPISLKTCLIPPLESMCPKYFHVLGISLPCVIGLEPTKTLPSLLCTTALVFST